MWCQVWVRRHIVGQGGCAAAVCRALEGTLPPPDAHVKQVLQLVKKHLSSLISVSSGGKQPNLRGMGAPRCI